MILVVFHTAGINEKKKYNYHEKKKKNLVQNLGYCPSELKVGLGTGLGVQALGRRRACAGRAWAAQGRAGRAQAGTAGVLGRWAWRAGRRAWARGQAQKGGSSARAQRARGRASGWRWRAGQAAAGARLGGRELGAGRTGPWAQARGACAAGAGSVRGIGRQGARLGAPGVLAGPVGGSCTRLDFRSVLTRFFS